LAIPSERKRGIADRKDIGVSQNRKIRADPDAAGTIGLGEQSVKNIARPVRVYALPPEAVAALAAPGVPATPPIPQRAAAPRLSIVVLPFTNLGNDPEQQYFADGITEDLTTDLSRIADMFVISRNTAFTYQGKRIDTKQVGRELGVRIRRRSAGSTRALRQSRSAAEEPMVCGLSASEPPSRPEPVVRIQLSPALSHAKSSKQGHLRLSGLVSLARARCVRI
jgi:hypothetical protein